MSNPDPRTFTNRGGRLYTKWLCDSGHWHPSHRHAVACNIRLRKWLAAEAVKTAKRAAAAKAA